ncbi:MAG: gamma-glutamyltransferase [Solirubrobacteraceae bacterium]|nr:gamma-glutamyltransferase [Solirubrobacteraceae bacterium]
MTSSTSRPAATAADHMVCASQGPAVLAGLAMLEQGGNAADAAVAAAAALCVCEPMSTGVGGDAFAIVHRDRKAEGLDSAGPAAADAPELPVPLDGPASVTVPGAVAGWDALLRRHGKLGLDACLAPAIDLAERGFAVAPRCAWAWRSAPRLPPGYDAVPAVGERVQLPALGATLRTIAEHGPDAIYRGEIAAAIAAASALSEDDLARFEARWVEPLRIRYRGVDVLELPPPTQGVVALEALGILQELTDAPTDADRLKAVRLALEDGRATVRDGADVSGLLDPARVRARAGDDPGLVPEPAGGTVYLCAVDGDGMAVSFIQSLYEPFGSGLVAGDTGVILQNRGACFEVEGRVRAGRRPYHTIIPGLLERDGALLGPFGIMGGFIQAQAHVQFVSSLVDDGLDPQAALDRPRFRVEPDHVMVERGAWEGPKPTDLPLRAEHDPLPFGGGQAILVEGDALIGGSDSRKDGYAAGR